MGMGTDSSTNPNFPSYPAGGSPTLGAEVGKYETPIPDIAQMYLGNLKKGLVDLPSFQEMYQSYRDVAEKGAARAGARITEAFGSQGGRYSSDLLGAKSGLERDLAGDLRSAASQYQLNLRQQQSGEVGKAVDYLNSRDIMGMNYLWQDYLRRTSPPPLLGAAATQPGGPPGAVAY